MTTPLTTSPATIAALRAAGAADVVQLGASWVEADAYVRETLVAGDPHGVYVPPFDHEDIWEGAAGLVDEVRAQMEGVPDALVCSVGGGGLLVGLARGLERAYGPEVVPVVAVETKGADSLAASVRAGRLVDLDAITSFATSLGARRVARKAFEIAEDPRKAKCVVVEDGEAAMGCWRFAEETRLLVEPACGASIVMCFGDRLKNVLPDLNEDSKVVVVVCGGSNVSMELIMKWKEAFNGRFE